MDEKVSRRAKVRKKRRLKKRRVLITVAGTAILLSSVILTAMFISRRDTQDIIVVMKSAAFQSAANIHVKKQTCVSEEDIAKLNAGETPSKKIAFLTIDDGPSEQTAKIMEILNKYKVKANFFILGNNISGYESVLKELAQQGSKIFVHSTSHQYENIYASADAFREDIVNTKNQIEKLGIGDQYMYRFPGGSNTGYIDESLFSKFVKILKENGMSYVDWNVSTGDAGGTSLSAGEITESINSQINNREYVNVLMHDANNKTSTVEALPGIIESLQSNGFTICELPAGIEIPHFKE